MPSGSDETPTINWHDAFNVPAIKGMSIDSYEWHLDNTDLNRATASEPSPLMNVSTWHSGGVYNTALPAPLNIATRTMFGRRFAATVTGMAVNLLRNGILSPGRSDTGLEPATYPPSLFADPPHSKPGIVILPAANDYAPGDKWTGHHVSTSRVEVYPSV